jgi:hypothetical protein
VALDVLSSIEDVQRSYVILAVAPVSAVGVATPTFGSTAADIALKRVKRAKTIGKTARGAASRALCGGESEFQNRVLRIAPRP